MLRIQTFHMKLILIFMSGCSGFHITNMTAPVVQDPREEMLLTCSFHMGDEQLYAVKWYKDGYEFFRFSPKGRVRILQFEVMGVQVDISKTSCNMSSCYLILTNLTRTHSSGQYRCEVSIEAPTFRLDSRTHNVIVAVIPQDKPVIHNINYSYLVGDLLVGTCLSDSGDPTPTITWYLNDEAVNSRYYRSTVLRQIEVELDLKKSLSHLRYPLNRKLLGNNTYTYVGVTCQQLTIIGKSLNDTKKIRVVSQEEMVNNPKIFGSTSPVYRGSLTKIIAAMIFVYK